MQAWSNIALGKLHFSIVIYLACRDLSFNHTADQLWIILVSRRVTYNAKESAIVTKKVTLILCKLLGTQNDSFDGSDYVVAHAMISSVH